MGADLYKDNQPTAGEVALGGFGTVTEQAAAAAPAPAVVEAPVTKEQLLKAIDDLRALALRL